VRRAPRDAAPQAVTAAAQPLLEHIAGSGTAIETGRVSRAWEMYEMPEVRFAARQYANAFSSAKLVLGRREVVGRDPEILLEPDDKPSQKAYELLQSFAGGPDGQVEFMDRMGVYFTVPGDMVAVGALDPAHMADNRFAKWDVWSTTEVRWDGQKVHIQTEATEDRFQEMPTYIRQVRMWNRHPRRGWESDSPVLSALKVLELVDIYDDRLMAEALSRLIGAGVWAIPQGMKLPTSTGDPAGGTPNDFLRLLMDVAGLAIGDRRSAAAMIPVLVEAAAEDIAVLKDSFISFSTDFSERLQENQEAAIRRWATGVDLPAEVLLGLAQATHWNSSLISEDKVQSFVVPSLRRAVVNLTWGWQRPALKQFNLNDPNLCVWFDPAGIKTRVDLSEEAEWGHENFLLGDGDAKYMKGLGQTQSPEGDALKKQMLMYMAQKVPEAVPDVLRELGMQTKVPGLESNGGSLRQQVEAARSRGELPAASKVAVTRDGPQTGPRPNRTNQLVPSRPGRDANLSTTEPKA
jgi:hypothetical protein